MAIQHYAGSFGDTMPQSFSSMMDRFFNDSLNARGRTTAFSPQIDAYETERSYEIEAALPGMKREDIKVEFQQGRLTISGERRMQHERTDRRYHVLESQYGTFHRSLQLPDVTNGQGIEAAFEDGVLRITVPKEEQKTVRHQIEIRGGQPASSRATGHTSERMAQQATDVPVESSHSYGHSHQQPDVALNAGASQGSRVLANGSSAAVGAKTSAAPSGQASSTSWIDTGSAYDCYGDGHPEDGAGSMRGSGVGS